MLLGRAKVSQRDLNIGQNFEKIIISVKENNYLRT